jgi:hypothetical protein
VPDGRRFLEHYSPYQVSPVVAERAMYSKIFLWLLLGKLESEASARRVQLRNTELA